MGRVIAISNRKGGCGKTTTAVNLGVALARQGKRVLLVDADSQHSLTVSLGVAEPDVLELSLGTIISDIITEKSIDPKLGIVRHSEGIDLMPANNSLAGMEIALVGQIGRETILRQYIDVIKSNKDYVYDFILVDTAPTLDLLSVNALAAADCVIIPVAPKYLDAKGLELLLKSIAQIRRHINPNLSISGILLTMVDKRTRFTKEVVGMIEQAYGESINIFSQPIPHSVRAIEASATGKSIFQHDPNGKVATAYEALAREIVEDKKVVKSEELVESEDVVTKGVRTVA